MQVSTSYTILPWWKCLCASITCKAALVGDKNLLLGLPIADRRQIKYSSTPTRWKILNPEW